MSRRGNETGHNPMLKRRRIKQLHQKRSVQAAERAENVRIGGAQ
jgi:hypothetical protein